MDFNKVSSSPSAVDSLNRLIKMKENKQVSSTPDRHQTLTGQLNRLTNLSKRVLNKVKFTLPESELSQDLEVLVRQLSTTSMEIINKLGGNNQSVKEDS